MVLVLLATPGIAGAIADTLSGGLVDALAHLLPGAHWQVRTGPAQSLTTPLVLTDVIDWARARLLEHDCDLLVLLTDLPLQLGRRPLLSHASSTHSVAVVSLPALGAVQLRNRARQAVLLAVQALVEGTTAGSRPGPPAHGRARDRTRARVQRLVRPSDRGDTGVAFVAHVLSGNLRLLAGMVRANRPWRLTLHLSRALIASLAAAAFALVTSDVWKLADQLGNLRLALVTAGAIGALTGTLIVAAELWESSTVPTARHQVMLFNAATTATVLIGILALYAALFGVTLAGAALYIPSDLLAAALHHPVSFADRAQLAWFVSGLATVGGALGAGLESDDAVREAAYANHGRKSNQHAHRQLADQAAPAGGARET